MVKVFRMMDRSLSREMFDLPMPLCYLPGGAVRTYLKKVFNT
jgi:hypothetical protein